MTSSTIDLIYNSIGIIGIALIILSFFLLQVGKLTSDHLSYSVLNLVGALMHLVSLYRFFNIASVIIEIFWIAISVYGIIKVRDKRSEVRGQG